MPEIKVLDAELYHEELSGGFRPKRPGDAGIDLRCSRDIRIEPYESATIPLGVAVQLPAGTVGWMTGRSSLTNSFGAISTEGKIDSGYRGEVHHFIHALNRPVEIDRGERICQLVVVKIVPPGNDSIGGHPTWDIVVELESSERGRKGLGSTGRS